MKIFLLTKPCIGLSIFKRRKALQVVGIDGKVMEFKAPILIQELVTKYEGFGIKSSRTSFSFLPSNFELQMGKRYYLFPIKAQNEDKNGVSERVELEANTTVIKRIKVVITKKQLEELLAKRTSVETIIFGIDKACSSQNWKPSLVPIPEENEVNVLNL